MTASCHRALLACLVCAGLVAAQGPKFQVVPQPGQVQFRVDGQPLINYVFSDPKITRPFFANAHVPGAGQVTRNYPTQPGDVDDNSLWHPGIWLSFGEVNGRDYWRLKDKTVHVRFIEPPKSDNSRLTFAVRNHYLDRGDKPVLVEDARYTLLLRPGSWWLLWDSAITPSAGSVLFGDPEEMGLGVRLATGLAVNADKGGRILDSKGRKNTDVWGLKADWCDYSGQLGGKWAGITVAQHPSNLRRSWWHARENGLLEANPFGERSGPPAKYILEAGDTLRLRYGIYLHSESSRNDAGPPAAYKEYLSLTATKKK